MQPPEEPERTTLCRLTADELALIYYYRPCCADHRQNIRLFAAASMSRCHDQLPGNVRPFLIAPTR
jgi:hypothetical protein